MDLLERYLQAVRKHLPRKRQDDIIAELRANLESQLEEKEADLGHPLTTPEAGDWIKGLGSPMQMAARYQTQQYLIGPALFPTYLYVIRMVLFWATMIYLVVNAVIIFTATPSVPQVVEVLFRLPFTLLTVAAWVTLGFAGVEFCRSSSGSYAPGFADANWSPETLPEIEKSIAEGIKRRTFPKAVAEVVFGLLFLLYLLAIPKHPALLMGPGAVWLELSRYALAPVWWTFYWWVVALNIVQTVWRALALVRDTWQQPPVAENLVMKALGFVPVIVLLLAGHGVFVVLKNPAADAASYGATLSTINQNVFRVLLLICTIAVVHWIISAVQAGLTEYRKRQAAR